MQKLNVQALNETETPLLESCANVCSVQSTRMKLLCLENEVSELDLRPVYKFEFKIKLSYDVEVSN
jgi:hypothetical protein